MINIKSIRRGSAFGTVGAGKSGVLQQDRKGYKIRKDRRLAKVTLKQYA